MCDETTIVRPSCAEATDDVLQVQALRGVSAGQRLVEQEERRVVHERGSEAHPLAHAAGVLLQPPVLRVDEVDRLDRTVDRAAEILEALQPRVELDELRALSGSRRPTRARSCTRCGDRGGGFPRTRLAEDAHRSLRGRDETGDRPEQRRLAGAVRTEQRR